MSQHYPNPTSSGANQPPSGGFCRHCGSPLPPQAGFCRKCGQPRLQPRPQNRRPRRLRAVALTLAAIVLVFVLLGIAGAFADDDSGNLGLGKTTELVSQQLGANGGQLKIANADSPLNGLTLAVPDGAYAAKQKWTIRETPIKDHQLGDLFHPVTPLITLDNGHIFAAKPMTLTIPITKATDEFAMAFYYDRTTGGLEGIPCLAQDNQSITLATAHFSDIVVSTVKKSMLAGRIQNDEATTDFLPGMSDFFAPNFGSIAEAGGHCTGQSLAEIHYYNTHSNDNHTGLSLRAEDQVDNGLRPVTAGFWPDDNLAYRFCSLLQRNFTWGTAYTDSFLHLPEDLVYYSFGYAMALTHSPQLIVIYGKDQQGNVVGHTMVVYEVTPQGLAIADPNYPGDLDRLVKVERDPAKPAFLGLANYGSGATANSPGTVFDEFAYFGTYALYNYDAIDQLWQDVLAGKDVAAGIFPADLSFLVMTGRDNNKQAIYQTLQNDCTLTRTQTAEINADKPDRIFLTIPQADRKAQYTLYLGTEKLGTVTGLGLDADQWVNFGLQKGPNDIGILYEQQDSSGRFAYVNFYRYTVHFTDGVPTPTPTPAATAAPTKATAGGVGNWQLTITWTSECQHSGGIAAVAHNLPFEQTDHLNKPVTSSVTLAESAVANPGAVSFLIAGYADYDFKGSLSADRQMITGEYSYTWTSGQHWIKGTFTMKRMP